MRNTRRRELVTTRRALVLAGGGLAGIAWETGVLRGIADESPAAARLLLDSDVLVGTSAGATVAAQISSGCPLDTLYERQLAETSAEIDPGVDIDAITDLFLTAVTEPHISTRRRLQRIGAVALAVDTVPESVRRQVIAQRLPSHDWPDRVLRVTAIDIATGELVVFHRESNVALVDAVAASCSVDAALQVGQAAAYPASMLIGPMMQLAQMGTTANTAGLAGAEAAGLAAADVPTFAGDIASGTGLGGAGGLGAGMSAELGKARLVGAMSVPPTWEGSVPARMASSAMAGLGAMPAEVPAAGGPMGMMPMPMGMGGAGAGMPAGMMGRGGANPHVVQARPSVVPRVGIG